MKFNLRGEKFLINPSIDSRVNLYYRQNGIPSSEFTFKNQKVTKAAEVMMKAAMYAKTPQLFQRELKPHFDFLVMAGILVPVKEVVREVSKYFYLDSSILKLLSSAAQKEFDQVFQKPQSLRFNELNVVIQTGSTRPKVDRGELSPDGMAPFGEKILWVFDPGTKMWAFYYASTEFLAVVTKLKRGTLKIEQIPKETLALLFHSQILTTTQYQKARKATWTELEKRSGQASKVGVGIFKGLLSPLQVAFLKEYSRNLRKEGYCREDDVGVSGPTRRIVHDDPVIDYFHKQSGDVVRMMLDEPVVATWQVISTYFGGTSLKKHTDILQCGWNVSLLIDAETTGQSLKSWPLFVRAHDKTYRNELELGDFVIYSGFKSAHWRKPLNLKQTETLLLWFYAPVSFKGSLHPALTN